MLDEGVMASSLPLEHRDGHGHPKRVFAERALFLFRRVFGLRFGRGPALFLLIMPRQNIVKILDVAHVGDGLPTTGVSVLGVAVVLAVGKERQGFEIGSAAG